MDIERCAPVRSTSRTRMHMCEPFAAGGRTCPTRSRLAEVRYSSQDLAQDLRWQRIVQGWSNSLSLTIA